MINHRIKELRKERALTQRELGELSGMSGQMIRNYESGYRTPKIENLQKIADALSVSIEDLMGKIPSVSVPMDVADNDAMKKRNERMKREVYILNSITRYFNDLEDVEAQKQFFTIVRNFHKMNDAGREILFETAEDLYARKKYRCKS